MYIITGIDREGKRFRIEKGFNSYMSYSIYSFYKTVGDTRQTSRR